MDVLHHSAHHVQLLCRKPKWVSCWVQWAWLRANSLATPFLALPCGS